MRLTLKRRPPKRPDPKTRPQPTPTTRPDPSWDYRLPEQYQHPKDRP